DPSSYSHCNATFLSVELSTCLGFIDAGVLPNVVKPSNFSLLKDACENLHDYEDCITGKLYALCPNGKLLMLNYLFVKDYHYQKKLYVGYPTPQEERTAKHFQFGIVSRHS